MARAFDPDFGTALDAAAAIRAKQIKRGSRTMTHWECWGIQSVT